MTVLVHDKLETQTNGIKQKICIPDTKAMLEYCKSSIKKTSGILHGLNVYATRVLDYAMDTAIAEEEWELALKYGTRALQTYK